MFKKGLLTSSIAILLLIGLGVTVYRDGVSIQDVLLGLTALGLLAAKDANQSHSLSTNFENGDTGGIGGNSGDPEEEEEPPGV